MSPDVPSVSSPDEVLAVVCARLGVERTMLLRRRRNSFDRAVASRMLCHHAGLTQRQAAQTLAIGNGASVSGQLSRLARELQSNRSLRNRVQEMEGEMKCRRDDRQSVDEGLMPNVPRNSCDLRELRG